MGCSTALLVRQPHISQTHPTLRGLHRPHPQAMELAPSLQHHIVPPLLPAVKAQGRVMLVNGARGPGSSGLQGREATGRLGPPRKDVATREKQTGQGQTRGSLTVHGNLHLLHVPEGQRPRQVPRHRSRGEDHGHGHHQLNLHRDRVSPGSRAPRAAAPGSTRRSPAAG